MNLPKLLLLDDPLVDWGLSKRQLTDSYYDLVNSSHAHLLGYKGDVGGFKTEINTDTSNLKYINLFSELRDYSGSGIDSIYKHVVSHKFTHDFLITKTHHPVIIKMTNELSKIFEVNPNDITFNFIEANVTLLAHRDTDYFDKTTDIPPPMLTMKSRMIADNALNWILLGNKSEFRLLADGKKYTNSGTNKLCFFDPCKYKHGTTLNTHRLILTVRFRTLKFKDMLPTLYNNFVVEEVQPS
jgi:hypothetical protein